MKQVIKLLLAVGGITLHCGSAFASEELPLSLHFNVRTRGGETTFLRGMPISLNVTLVNAQVRRAEEEAKRRWREQAREAEKEGREVPDFSEFVAQPSLLMRVSENNIEWFSRVELTIERIKPERMPVLQAVRWDELLEEPESVDDEPVILGKVPISVSLRIPPELTEQLSPGDYRVTGSYPEAEPDTSILYIEEPETDDERAVVHYERAEYSLAKKEYDEALKFAQLALGKLSREHDMIYLTLGDAYAGQGELEKAVEAYEHFLQTYEGSERWDYPRVIRQKVEDMKRQIQARKGR
ncbi:MAG: hypothetical protein JSV84_02735 [Gemmatimonadota bacterium]|nr:MAG: hypothetical protein JSV84_02735 [Gemmatimonadota bacterium]